MTARNCRNAHSRLIVRALCALTVVALLPALAYAAPEALPPRPTPAPSPIVAPGSGSAGAFIKLRLNLKPGWQTPWQQLWTVVQWQDRFGVWHDVEGWQGTPDEAAASTCSKEWWVGDADLGTGPFRWMVYQNRGGRLLAASPAFNLPGAAGATTVVEMALEP